MLKNISRSLEDILGESYTQAVKSTAVAVMGINEYEADAMLKEKVDFYPSEYRERINELIKKVGMQIVPPLNIVIGGAPTESFREATNLDAAPIGGLGCVRIGQDGKVYMVTKSEHYQASLGHSFPGYQLIDRARRLGIPNATHNNTRGFITRLMEQKIIMDINRIQSNGTELSQMLASRKPKILNRIINLETGSLAVEAAIKMMLARFYRVDKGFPKPEYAGKIPVFLVIAGNDGGCEANYHGTTIFAQTFRDMWPELYEKNNEQGIYRVVGVKYNDIDDFKKKIGFYNSGGYKTAGFLHEIILMNYGGIRLHKGFLQNAYALCDEYDTPTLADEIQSCIWYKDMFLLNAYDLHPDFVAIGKGFPGGEYPASKVITTYQMDKLNQFGALVTNGQDELASLAYLITMEFVRENGEEIAAMGKKINADLTELHRRYNSIIDKVEGLGHLSAIHFHTVEAASNFMRRLNDKCIDASAQLYKAKCPPAVLFKLPLIIDCNALSVLFEKMDEVLMKM